MRLAHARRGTARRAAGADEAGETLIELIVTVILLGTAIVTLLGGLFSVVVLVGRHRQNVATSARATETVETLQRATYVPCTATPDPTTAYSGLFSTPGASIYSVKYLQSQTANPAVFTTTCPATDQGVTEVVVEVTSGTGTSRVVTRQTILKRADDCPGSMSTTTVAGQRC
ncbi:hypothetical protein [Aquihabitans sp. McL0605]|uniref:hypothetical protein n=1 Tax=Aquihabitans sp. McL0605 TaxID=3415671 RepID=UPI003CF8E0AF